MNVSSCGLPMIIALLVACDSSAQQKSVAEQRRIECLDRLCEGDVEPQRDLLREVALKINGKWFIGPRKYFSSFGNRSGFEWWDHKPLDPDAKRPPEAQALAVAGKGYDFSVEVFLGTPTADAVRSSYQQLLEEERRGHVIEKRKVRDGLEVWRSRAVVEETWYIATNLKDPSGDPPTVACRGADPTKYRCTGGFLWQPDVAADLRFRATHASDWPEIYLEISRVLQLLRKA